MQQEQQMSGGAEGASWWYSTDGAAAGPVSWESLLRLARESVLGPGEHVRREDWSEWRVAMNVLPPETWPAAEALPATDAQEPAAGGADGVPRSAWEARNATPVPGDPQNAFTAPAGLQGPATLGALPYRGTPVHGEVVAGAATLDLLRRSVLWTRIAAIGLLAIAGISVVVLMMIVAFDGDLEATLVALVGVAVLAVWYAVPGILLLRFAAAASRTWRQRSPADLEQAVRMQLRLWQYLVILAAVFVVGYFAVIMIAIAFAI